MTPTLAQERQIKVSIYGSGREHYHVILSKSSGLDRVIAVSTFDTWTEAGHKAQHVKAVYETMGFESPTFAAGTILKLVKPGEPEWTAYLMTRRCHMRHQIDG